MELDSPNREKEIKKLILAEASHPINISELNENVRSKVPYEERALAHNTSLHLISSGEIETDSHFTLRAASPHPHQITLEEAGLEIQPKRAFKTSEFY